MLKYNYRFEDHSFLANALVLLCVLPVLILLLAVTMVVLPVCILSWLPVLLIGRTDDKIRGKTNGRRTQEDPRGAR